MHSEERRALEIGAPSRRTLLAGTAGAALLLAAPRAVAQQALPSTIRIYVPFGRGSTVAVAFEVLRSGLSSDLSRRVIIDVPPLPDRMLTALKGLSTPGGGELRLLATDTLLQAIYDAAEQQRNPKSVPSLDVLVPVATLTVGYSTALFVSAESAIHDWEGFVGAARNRQLTIASSNPGSIHLRFLEQAIDEGFRDVLAPTRQRIFEAVLEGRAAAGMINTPTLVAFMKANPARLRAIVTFGGERNPDLDVPTLREVTGRRGFATTNTVGLFAPPGTPPDVVELLRAGLVEVAQQKEVASEAAAIGLPLKIDDAEDLRQTVERDKAVVVESGL